MRPDTGQAWLERVNLAIDYVMRHLAEPLRLAAVARAARLSPFHFHRVFQALVGTTLADFVRRARLDRALTAMMRPEPPSLTRIALEVGFASASDFSRAFKQRFGVAPSRFDLAGWRRDHAKALRAKAPLAPDPLPLAALPPRRNPDAFRVRLRELPERTVAYLRVDRPYEPDAVPSAARRLVRWAEHRGFAERPWLGFQWENPEVVALEDCRYYVAVEVDDIRPEGEIGRTVLPPMRVAEVEVKGSLELELRALRWLFGVWLPRSRFVPASEPCFEAWIGRPFAHGLSHFELRIQLPIERG